MPKITFTSAVGIVLLLVLVGTVLGLLRIRQYGEVATGFVARQMCMCIYVQSRPEEQCLAELGEAAEPVNIVYFDETVITDFYGLTKAQARLRPGFGCSVTSYSGTMPNAVR